MTLTLTVVSAPQDKAPAPRTIAAGSFTIGRAPDNDWVLQDPDLYLSKRHCVISLKGRSWEVADFSANGTFLNRDPDPIGAGRARDLRDGDRLMVGDYEIEVRIVDRGPILPDDPFATDRREPQSPAFPTPPAYTATLSFGATPGYAAPFGQGRPADSLIGPAQSDHSPGIADAFTPPRPVVMLSDDWDLDGVKASALAAAAAAPPPAPPPALSGPVIPPLEAPAVAAPAAPAPAGDLMAAFLRGARLPDARPGDPERAMEALGAAFRAMVGGLRDALVARAATKQEFRIHQTMIRATGNNPLKFAASEDDALLALLGAGRRADQGPAEAVAEAMKDMRLHELATLAAMQSAVRGLLRDLAPEKLREEAEKGGMSLLDAQRKLRAWDLFEAQHARLTQGLSDDFDTVFGRAFALAYEQALQAAAPARKGS